MFGKNYLFIFLLKTFFVINENIIFLQIGYKNTTPILYGLTYIDTNINNN